MKLIPNPEYEAAEYAESYIFASGRYSGEVEFGPELRFRAKDRDEIIRLQDAGLPYRHLAVPTHIPAPE